MGLIAYKYKLSEKLLENLLYNRSGLNDLVALEPWTMLDLVVRRLLESRQIFTSQSPVNSRW